MRAGPVGTGIAWDDLFWTGFGPDAGGRRREEVLDIVGKIEKAQAEGRALFFYSI